MRVTVCELPHEPRALTAAWAGLCQHTMRHGSELVLLPECAFADPVWEGDHFDAARWALAQAQSDVWLARLPELNAAHVVGSRLASIDDGRFNQGYLWSRAGGVTPLRSKAFLPEEPGWWETRWFDRGDPGFPLFRAGALWFGLNICTELWALDTYATYSSRRVEAILSPRATGAATTDKWLSVGMVAAVRSGAFSLSSNRVDRAGGCGGVGWIISPSGQVLGRTSRDVPFVTIDIDLAASDSARASYPCYVFNGSA